LRSPKNFTSVPQVSVGLQFYQLYGIRSISTLHGVLSFQLITFIIL
jgi:hypothetical protein